MSKTIEVGEHILSINDQQAAEVRALLDVHGVFAINLMASPGGGKTSVILRSVAALKDQMRIAAIDGDVVEVDIEKIAAEGIPVELINTGGACHLEARQVLGALDKIDLAATDLLIVENVGNLVCPASFELGVHANVVIASVPEGDDKPYKYPTMFRGADVLLLNKIDYLELAEFDVDHFRRGVEALNPDVAFFPLSAKTGKGFEAWLDWLRGMVT